MDSINSNLMGNTDLLSGQLQSNAVVKKAAAAATDNGDESVGNILQSFGGLLKDQMTHINNLQSDANQAQQTYAVGGNIELHNVMLATEKADLALQLAMQVRNKVVSAYQEISRMNV